MKTTSTVAITWAIFGIVAGNGAWAITQNPHSYWHIAFHSCAIAVCLGNALLMLGAGIKRWPD